MRGGSGYAPEFRANAMRTMVALCVDVAYLGSALSSKITTGDWGCANVLEISGAGRGSIRLLSGRLAQVSGY